MRKEYSINEAGAIFAYVCNKEVEGKAELITGITIPNESYTGVYSLDEPPLAVVIENKRPYTGHLIGDEKAINELESILGFK